MKPKDQHPHKTKKEVIIEFVREAILLGELVPGERLLQENLAERFDVSPTPIREAIQQLVAEGILSHSPYRSVQVAEVHLDEVRQVYLIRSALEELATRTAVLNLLISDVLELRNLNESFRERVQNNDLQALRKLNFEFHMLIYKTANMPLLLQMIQTLWTKFPWDTLHVLPNRAEAAADEHELILNAINDGSAELAGQLMRNHIECGSSALQDYLSENGPSHTA